MEKISVKDFTKKLRTELEDIADTKGWNFDKEYERNFAFQLWVAKLFCRAEDFDMEPEDSVLLTDKMGTNLVLEDSTRRYLIIANCRYSSLGKKKSYILEEETKNFFDIHRKLIDKNWVRAHSNEIGFQILGDYKAKLEDGYYVDYFYISTADSSESTLEVADKYSNQYAEQALQIKCNLVGFSELKELYVRSLSLNEASPSTVRLKLPDERFFEIKDPGGYPTVVAVVKGNALRDLYKQYRESLFAWNIRGYLGSNSINSEILWTAKEQPQNFFYYNNGVSAICTEYEIIDNSELVATNFQIINGAQTVGTLGRAKENTGIQVLLRVTRTASVKTEKGINSEIIRYNNSQNSIKLSDFRSNDPIQSWLEKKFSEIKPRGPLPAIRYSPKRQKEDSSNVKIKFEDLAKIRYAFLWEPTRIHSSPKDLWTHRTEDGVYEKAFGVSVEGSEFWEVPEAWSEECLQQCLVAIVLFLRIDLTFKEEAKEQKKFKILSRLKYHALSLIGIFLVGNKQAFLYKELLGSQKKLDELWDKVWPQTKFVLIDAYERAVEEDKTTLYALVRSVERWQHMRRRFIRYANLSDVADES